MNSSAPVCASGQQPQPRSFPGEQQTDTQTNERPKLQLNQHFEDKHPLQKYTEQPGAEKPAGSATRAQHEEGTLACCI